MNRLLSVVVPIYLEEHGINELYNRIKKVLVGLESRFRHEMIFVNDGSTDRSPEILKELSQKDNTVRVINFSRNFGHQIAITAGIDHASGDAVVVIDGDLQDPPEVIRDLVAKWEEGYKVVYGIRKKRKGESAFRLFCINIFYRLMKVSSNIKIPLDSGDFRLLDRVVVNALKQIREENRYIRGLTAWIGFSQYGLYYDRDKRYAGETKYAYKKLYQLAIDGFTSFSDKPLQLSSQLGMLITIIALFSMVWVIFRKVTFPETIVPGWTSILVVILFLGGVQLLSIGILGMYIGRIYRETKRRPLYFVANRYGFDDLPAKNQEDVQVNQVKH